RPASAARRRTRARALRACAGADRETRGSAGGPSIHLHEEMALTFKRRTAGCAVWRTGRTPRMGRDPVHKLHTPRWVFVGLKFITDAAPKPPIPRGSRDVVDRIVQRPQDPPGLRGIDRIAGPERLCTAASAPPRG